MKHSLLVTLTSFVVLAGCGGPGENATIPEAQPAAATNANIGDHVVHFSAISTDQLPTDVAQLYGIVRSKNRAMLNVSVLDDDGIPVTADVAVQTVNLTGQVKNVSIREIREDTAIYYIGDVGVANRETLVFDISVTPEGETTASDLRFKRQFYTD
ncbi:MAG: DUF4426 domain-containing protein [Pseudomonadota bacterium]